MKVLGGAVMVVAGFDRPSSKRVQNLVAENCTAEITQVVRGYIEVGGNPNEYDPGVDRPGELIRGAKTAVFVAGTNIAESKDGADGVVDGKIVTRFAAPCNATVDSKPGLKVDIITTTPDGRNVRLHNQELANLTGKNIGVYIKDNDDATPTSAAIPASTPVRVPTPIQSGQTIVAIPTQAKTETPVVTTTSIVGKPSESGPNATLTFFLGALVGSVLAGGATFGVMRRHAERFRQALRDIRTEAGPGPGPINPPESDHIRTRITNTPGV